MSLRNELINEYKSLVSNLEEIQLVAGETDLLNQTRRVLSLSAKCIEIMGKVKPTKPIGPPKKGKNLGKTLYTRDRRTTAAPNVGYLESFTGEKNIENKFVSNREILVRKLKAQTALADKMKFQTKVYYSKMELELEKHNRAERVSSGKLNNALNDKKRLLKICKKQEYTIDEQKRIIEGLKYKLKRRWDTDPVIDISPRTRNLAKTVLGQKTKSAKQRVEIDPLTGKKKVIKTKKKTASKKAKKNTKEEEIRNANIVDNDASQDINEENAEERNPNKPPTHPPVPPEKLVTTKEDKQLQQSNKNINEKMKNAVLNCIGNVLNSKTIIEKWKALEYLPMSFFNCHACRLYVVDGDAQQLVRYVLNETEDIGGNSKGNLNYVENRYQLNNGKCVYGNVGAMYRGYAIDVIQNGNINNSNNNNNNNNDNANNSLGSSLLVSNKLEDPKFVSYAPAKSVMVVPFLSQNGSVYGCFECTNVEQNFNENDLKQAQLIALQLSTFLAFDRRNEKLISQVEGKGILLAALKPENLAELSLPKLLKSLTVKTKEVLNAERCIWYILDKDRGILWSRFPNEGKKLKVSLKSKGVPGHVFRERDTINIADLDRHNAEVELNNEGTKFEVTKDYMSIVGRVRSTLAMPMVGENKSIMGVVQVFNKLNSPIGFTAEDEINLKIISNHGAIAIENAAILQEARNSHSIGLDFSSDVQAIDVLDRVIHMSKKDTHAQHGVIYMYNHGDSFMQLYNPHHTSADADNDEKNAGGVEWTSVDLNCIAGDCATTGKTVILPDGTVGYDQRFNKDVNKIVMGLEDVKMAMEANRATLCEPVHDQDGNVIAVLQVINKNKKYRDRGAYSFDRTDALRLHNIARIAAISLQNALLHEETANSKWRLHELLDCTLALTKEHHLPTLLTMINHHAKDVLEAEACTMWLVEGDKEKKLVMNRNTDEEHKGAIAVHFTDGILGQVATTREVLIVGKSYHEEHNNNDNINSTEGIHHIDSKDKNVKSALYIPMVSSHDEVMGVIHLQNKLGGRHFSDEDIALAKAFCAQAATAIENVHMFQRLAQLRAYSKSISPTTNNFVFSLDIHGRLEHASHNPKYVLGLDIDFMRKEPYHKWLGHRNHILEHHLEQAYHLKKPVSVQLTNAVYHNQHGQTTVTNVAIVPRFSIGLDLDGVIVTMTQIKRHATLSIMEGRFRTDVNRIPWPQEKTLPYRYMYQSSEVPAEPLHCDDKQVQRKYLEPETGILCIAIDLTFDEYPPTSGGHDSQEATIGSHHILRDIKRSTFHPKEEDYDISDANGSTSNETSMTRLSAQDFLKKFIFDVTCMVNESKGVMDRVYNTNVLIAAFGVQQGGKADAYVDSTCQMAIKVTDLAHAFQSELTQYYDTHYSGKIKPWLNVRCGVHSCIAQFTQPVEDEETDDIDEDKEEDAPQIYRLMDEDIDLSMEMIIAASKLGISRVVSPHAAALFKEKLNQNELIMRKIDTVHSMTLNSNSNVYELVAYKELGFHQPGFLRSIKYFENGLDSYENKEYPVAIHFFNQAYALSKDSLTLLYIERCKTE